MNARNTCKPRILHTGVRDRPDVSLAQYLSDLGAQDVVAQYSDGRRNSAGVKPPRSGHTRMNVWPDVPPPATGKRHHTASRVF